MEHALDDHAARNAGAARRPRFYLILGYFTGISPLRIASPERCAPGGRVEIAESCALAAAQALHPPHQASHTHAVCTLVQKTTPKYVDIQATYVLPTSHLVVVVVVVRLRARSTRFGPAHRAKRRVTNPERAVRGQAPSKCRQRVLVSLPARYLSRFLAGPPDTSPESAGSAGSLRN